MKKIVLIASLCMFAGFSFAQKKVVREAKSNMDKTAEAREIIKPALTNEETANDPETWKIAGDIEYKSFEKEYDAEMTKQFNNGKGGNVETMYTGLYNMVDLYKKADELGQQPDEKGRVKNKVRKDIVKNFRVAYPFCIDAGAYYNDKGLQANRDGNKAEADKLYAKSADFFEMYWDLPSLPMFQEEKDPLVVPDSIFQTIKYYAVVSAIQSNDSERSIKMLEKIIASPYIETSVQAESDPYELLAVEYDKIKDTVNYVRILKLGAEKFPKNQYFTPNLINEYIRAGKITDAMEHLDQAVSNDPDSRCELLSVKGSLLITDKKYEEGVATYQEALKFDSNCERALEGLGVMYVLQAQELKEKVGQETDRQKIREIDEQTKELYQKSLPLLEKFVNQMRERQADPFELRAGLVKLQNVYYNLSLLGISKEAELDVVEKEIEALK